MQPSPRSSTIAGFLSQHRLSIPREASRILEERDAAWRSENDDLQSDCQSLSAELNRKLEGEFSMGRIMQKDIAWFALEEENVRMERTIGVLNKKIDDFEHEIGRLKSKKKMDESDRVSEKKQVEVEVRKLNNRLAILEANKAELSPRIQVLEKEALNLVRRLSTEFQLSDKIEHKIRMEADLKKKIFQLVDRIKVLEEEKRRAADRIGVLERDKGALAAKVSKQEMERNCVNLTMQKVKKTLEDEKRILEEEKDEKISELEKRTVALEEAEKRFSDNLKMINVLERAKEASKAVFLKVEEEKSKEIDMISNEKRILEEVKNKKISELEIRVVALEGEKAQMEAEVQKANKDKSHESDRIAEINEALEAEKVLSENLKTISLLEKAKEASKVIILKVLNEKRILEEDKNKKISELAKRSVVLEGEKAEMEAQVHKANKDKTDESNKIVEVKKAVEDQMRRAEEAEKRFSDNLKMIRVLEMAKEASKAIFLKVDEDKSKEMDRILNEKRILEEVKNKKISELEKKTVVLEGENAEMKAEVHKANKDKRREYDKKVEVKKSLEAQIGVLKREKEESEANVLKVNKDKSEIIVRILNEKMALEGEKRRLEEEKNKKILEHVEMTEVLKREKAKLEAEVRKAKNGKNTESDRIVVIKKALGAQKRQADAAEKQVSELLETIGVLETAKEALEAKILKVDKEKCDETEWILNKKKTMEDEGTKRIEALEREKKEMENMFCQRILNDNSTMEAEKKAMKDEYEKKKLELSDRISILEREKRGLEAEIALKDEAIKVLYQENCLLEGVKKELEMEINVLGSKLKENVQLLRCVHLTDIVGTLSTLLQNEGKKSAGVAYSNEHGGSVNHNVENSDVKSEDGVTCTSACKRKRTIRKCEEVGKKIQRSTCVVDDKLVLVPCEKNKEMNSTRRTNGSDGAETQATCKWEVDKDLLDAFDVSPELCLKAVCALYRQHKRHKRVKRLHHMTNASLSPGAGVSKQGHFSMAKPLAKYLIDEISVDNRMTKLVGKLDKIDVLAVGECRNIAKEHYKQVFEIYKKKEDPLFLS